MTRRQTNRPEGADLLDRLHEALTKFVAFPSDAAAHGVALWIAATHAQPAWDHATRLVLKSPIRRCGKTRALEVIRETAHKPINTSDATVAALFRSIAARKDDPPTLLLDEADAKFGSKRQAEANEDLRGLINAGYRRGHPTLRCVGPNHEPTEFPNFAMVALASIRDLPDTIEDRALTVAMQRRGPGEHVAPFRLGRDVGDLNGLRDELHEWVRDNKDALEEMEPPMEPLEDRAADIWEPLVAVADLAGGDWPELARQAAIVMTEENESAGVEASRDLRLLADLHSIFHPQKKKPIESLWTTQLLGELHDISESPWAGGLYSEPLDAYSLAAMLRPYGIRSANIKGKKKKNEKRPVRKGYKRADLLPVWERYLPSVAGGSGTVADTEPAPTSHVADVAEVAPSPGEEQPDAKALRPMLREIGYASVDLDGERIGGSHDEWKEWFREATDEEREQVADAIQTQHGERPSRKKKKKKRKKE